MVIRHARPGDLERVVAILNQAADFPVDTDQRRNWFHERDPGRRPLWVAEVDGTVAGWLAVDDFYGRVGYEGSVQIGAYVDRAHRHAGIGTALLEHCIQRAPGLRIAAILSYILADNDVPIAICAAHGFEEWGRLRGVAQSGDVVIMGLRVADASRSRSDLRDTATAHSR
jgi:L-amino acid N-acyltransferase YncA